MHDGRGLAALTHTDVLSQEFLVAYLLMNSLNVPLNPGTPYAPGKPDTKTQNGFNTFGGPDIASTFATVARQRSTWYGIRNGTCIFATALSQAERSYFRGWIQATRP